MIIYQTTNLINNKIYIGKDIHNNPNYLGSGLILKKAITKYGKENFIKEILEYCLDENELNEKEKYWIKEKNSIEIGYNLTEGGTGGDTFTNNPKKEQIRNKLKNRHHSEETKKKISENSARLSGENHPRYNTKETKETKEKRRITFLENGFPMKDKKHSEISKDKIRTTKIGCKVSEETKKKMSKAKKGKSTKKIKCPYCNMIGGISQMKQWHFEKCKNKTIS